MKHESGLIWWPGMGMGFYPVEQNGVYGEEYWKKYAGYATTDRGRELTRRRVELVEKYAHAVPVVDIGIGCGQFVETRGGPTYGFDVNPVAVEWLNQHSLWRNPYKEPPQAITCWDSLEHIEKPAMLLLKVYRLVFVSIPIFRDMTHVLQSRHFRKDEHYWYFTQDGFVKWMADLGFTLLEENRMEEECGREDIGTFVFERESKA